MDRNTNRSAADKETQREVGDGLGPLMSFAAEQTGGEASADWSQCKVSGQAVPDALMLRVRREQPTTQPSVLAAEPERRVYTVIGLDETDKSSGE